MIFINVSNHPSLKWSEGQIKAAKEFAPKVTDITFPNVPPEADKSEVLRLASKVISEVRNLEVDYDGCIVHVMGEMGLTYILVNKLKNLGIQVVHSTTERISEEKDGQKITVFRFCQFREY